MSCPKTIPCQHELATNIKTVANLFNFPITTMPLYIFEEYSLAGSILKEAYKILKIKRIRQ